MEDMHIEGVNRRSVPRHILHGNHLQMLNDRELHEELLLTQTRLYPESIIVTPAVMGLHHDESYSAYLATIQQNHPDAVWYMLPLGSYGALKDYHCNGCRFGTEPSDYISFPQVLQLGE